MALPRQVPRLTWKWGGRTNPFKSGNSSSVANLEKNIHCSWQDGHIIGTGNTWIFRKCPRKKIFVHNFSHNHHLTILPPFDHCPACLVHHKDFSFSTFLYFSQALFCICLTLRQTTHHFHCVFQSFYCVYKHAWFVSLKWSHFDPFWTIFFIRSTVNLEWFSGETVLEMLAWHCSTLREDINAITIMNNHLSWLEPSPQIPAPVFFKTKTPCCPVSWWHSQEVVQWFPASLELRQQWNHEKT